MHASLTCSHQFSSGAFYAWGGSPARGLLQKILAADFQFGGAHSAQKNPRDAATGIAATGKPGGRVLPLGSFRVVSMSISIVQVFVLYSFNKSKKSWHDNGFPVLVARCRRLVRYWFRPPNAHAEDIFFGEQPWL
jgi:hypothetical protein